MFYIPNCCTCMIISLIFYEVFDSAVNDVCLRNTVFFILLKLLLYKMYYDVTTTIELNLLLYFCSSNHVVQSHTFITGQFYFFLGNTDLALYLEQKVRKIKLINVYFPFTERRGRAVNTPASYSEGPGSKSRPGDRIS
jgi:hypothetical protein